MAGQNREKQQANKAKRPRQVKEKFMAERREKINTSPLVPMNPLQKEYIRLIREKPIVIATGLPGTSKTYIPTVIACDEYRVGNIDYIYITRPAISNSKSLGFFGGDLVEKMSNWLGPVLSIMRERLGQGALEIAIKNGDIQFIPFEIIKGYSMNRCFVLCDEAEDINAAEAKKFVTRLGKDCTAVLAGDIGQSELKDNSGLRKMVDMVKKHPELESSTGWIDFDRPGDIVRSDVCRDWTMAFYREEQSP